MKKTQSAEAVAGASAPASSRWAIESNKVFDEEVAFQPRFGDPETGVMAIRLTSEPCISHNIYPEAPIITPDGKRFIFARRRALEKHETFWIGDIETLRIRQVTDEEDAAAPVVAADGTWLYYSAGRQVMRLSPETFEREAIFEVPDDELAWVGGIVSLDATGTRFLAPAKGRSGMYGVAVIDIAARTARIIYEGPDVHNPLAIFGLHGQYSRNADRKVLIQVNNGMEIDRFGNIARLIGDMGASLVVVNDDGSHPLVLKAGFSLLERVQGHQCWVGHKDMVLTTLHRRQGASSPWIQDRVVAIVPGEEYRIVGQGKGFTHIGSSPDGEWWVADDNKTGDIYIGSITTARYKLFWRSGATFGSPQYTHPHPFFLGDGKSVGWNSDVTGVPQVYAARIPEGFLDSLR
jgi:oligogalacturonide lyase